jgi:hypothetical protein
MSSPFNELVSTSLGEMRAAASAWEGLDPQERRRRIRDYLVRQAEAASIEPEVLGEAVAREIPASVAVATHDAESERSGGATVGSVEDDLPKDPVERIIALAQSLTPIDRRRLLERMRALDMLPPVPPVAVAARPPEPAIVSRPTPEVAPVPTPPVVASRSSSSSSSSTVGDQALIALASAFGVHARGRRGAAMSVDEVEAALAREGVKRASLTADVLATALGHVAKGVASLSEEGEQNAHGLPEAIRSVLPNSRRAPVNELKNYLAGVQSADKLHDYIDEYFEPYRQLSLRMPDLCRRLKAVSEQLSPREFEKNAPKGWGGGVAYDKLWDQYKQRHAGYQSQGFGTSEEATRTWLLRLWLH